jgi:hypothetical protein
MSLLWDAPVETPALRLGFVSASLDETRFDSASLAIVGIPVDVLLN